LHKANTNAKTEKPNATIDIVESVDGTVAVALVVVVALTMEMHNPLLPMTKLGVHVVQFVTLLQEVQLTGQPAQFDEGR